jgi:excisionase family DNA binding protein
LALHLSLLLFLRTLDSHRKVEEETVEIEGYRMIEKMQSRLFTVQEAARYLAVSASTLYGWVWQRRISFVKVGRALRFDVRDLERFIDENREAASRQKG